MLDKLVLAGRVSERQTATRQGLRWAKADQGWSDAEFRTLMTGTRPARALAEAALRYSLVMADRPPGPKASTLEKLCALSCNRCAFRDPEKGNQCNEPIAKLEWDYIHAQACHIEAARPKGPRYRVDMTDEERRDFDNLILLCHNHHDLVDRQEPKRFSVEVLKKMKADHEGGCSESKWAAENRELVQWMVKGLQIQASYGVEGAPPISSVRDSPEGGFETQGGAGYGTGAYGTSAYGGGRPGNAQQGVARGEISLEGRVGSDPRLGTSQLGTQPPAGAGDWSHPVTIQLQQLLGYDHIRADDPMDDGEALIYRTDLTGITDAQAKTIEELASTVARSVKLVNPSIGQEWRYPSARCPSGWP